METIRDKVEDQFRQVVKISLLALGGSLLVVFGVLAALIFFKVEERVFDPIANFFIVPPVAIAAVVFRRLVSRVRCPKCSLALSPLFGGLLANGLKRPSLPKEFKLCPSCGVLFDDPAQKNL